MHNVKFTLDNIISYRVTEEYNLVPNPIYNISMQHMANNPQQQISTTIAGDDTAVTYEEVINVSGNKPNTSISDTPAESQLGTDV